MVPVVSTVPTAAPVTAPPPFGATSPAAGTATLCPTLSCVLATKKGMMALAIPAERASIYSGVPIGPPNFASRAAVIVEVNDEASADSFPVIGIELLRKGMC